MHWPVWRARLQRRGPKSDLRLVVAGTSPQSWSSGDPPGNEALLLNHRGQIIGRQRKLHRWNLNLEIRKQYALLAPGLADVDLLYEHISPGEEVEIIEHSQLGRLAVMICEDLGRTQPGQWLRANMFLDWL